MAYMIRKKNNITGGKTERIAVKAALIAVKLIGGTRQMYRVMGELQ